MKSGTQTLCVEHGMVKAWDLCFNCGGEGTYKGEICDICDGKGFIEFCPACKREWKLKREQRSLQTKEENHG